MRVFKIPRIKKEPVTAQPPKKPKISKLARKREQQEKFAAHLRENATASELAVCRLLDSLNIKYEFQAVISGFYPDFLFRGHGKILELDGKWHNDRKAFDKRRDKILRRAGFEVLRLPSSLVFNNCDLLIRQVQDYLDSVPLRRIKQPKSYRRRKWTGQDFLYKEFLRATKGI